MHKYYPRASCSACSMLATCELPGVMERARHGALRSTCRAGAGHDQRSQRSSRAVAGAHLNSCELQLEIQIASSRAEAGEHLARLLEVLLRLLHLHV